MRTIPSILHPTERAYEFHKDWSPLWDKRGNAHLSLHVAQYDTYGDGLTKHSGSWCVQFSELTDFCLSIAKAIMDEPQSEDWHTLHDWLHLAHDDSIRFALSVVYKESPTVYKPQYYSLTERKVSTSDTKRNDRRWEKVETWMDGTCKSAMSLLLRDTTCDWIKRAFLALRVREVNYELTGNWADWVEVFSPLGELIGDCSEHLEVYQALESLRCALRASEALDAAERQFSCAVQNATPRKEVAA